MIGSRESMIGAPMIRLQESMIGAPMIRLRVGTRRPSGAPIYGLFGLQP